MKKYPNIAIAVLGAANKTRNLNVTLCQNIKKNAWLSTTTTTTNIIT